MLLLWVLNLGVGGNKDLRTDGNTGAGMSIQLFLMSSIWICDAKNSRVSLKLHLYTNTLLVNTFPPCIVVALIQSGGSCRTVSTQVMRSRCAWL